MTCEFKSKNSFTVTKSCMKTEQFLLTVKSSVYSQLNIKELDHKTKEKLTSLRIRWGFLLKYLRVVEKLWAVFMPRRNHWTQPKLLKPKYRETKLKSTRIRIFWALEDINKLLLVAAWLELLHWTLNRLDLPPEAFTTFCLEMTFLISQPFQFFCRSTMLGLFVF